MNIRWIVFVSIGFCVGSDISGMEVVGGEPLVVHLEEMRQIMLVTESLNEEFMRAVSCGTVEEMQMILSVVPREVSRLAFFHEAFMRVVSTGSLEEVEKIMKSCKMLL